MNRLLSAVLLLLLLNACAGMPFHVCPPGSVPPVEQEIFISALKQFSMTGKVDSLRRFQQNYPDTEYAEYADRISQLTGKAHLQEENRQLKAQLDQLQQENSQLNEKLELVKKLLIDLERQQQ